MRINKPIECCSGYRWIKHCLFDIILIENETIILVKEKGEKWRKTKKNKSLDILKLHWI